MRQFIIGTAMLLTAGSAMASSIEIIGKAPRTDGGSIVTETCTSCPPLQTAERKKDYTVPTLAPGAFQQSALRDVGGEPKLFRTEGWMGGSPVVFVSKATPEVLAAFKATVPAEGIDPTATTSVTGGDMKPVIEGMAGPAEQTAPLDVSSFKLRMGF
jgi:hypothetical protein